MHLLSNRNCSSWLIQSIVFEETLKGRILLLNRFIKLARHLVRMNNFLGVVAIVSGISSAAILRLKFTRNGLSRSSQKV